MKVHLEQVWYIISGLLMDEYSFINEINTDGRQAMLLDVEYFIE